MGIFLSVLSLLAGSAVFIVGMNTMSDGLQKSTGAGTKRLLGKISNSNLAGIGIGTAITALIQSSAATTVMSVGLVSAGAMGLTQAAAVTIGANIGTTVTGLLVSLSSLQNTSTYLAFLAFVGVVLSFFKSEKVKNIGKIVCGLGMLFIGLDLMSAAFAESGIKQFFVTVFTDIKFPLLLILFGVAFTALLQSSSAMTGLIIVTVGQGALSVDSALYIILGINIGKTVVTLFATAGSSEDGKRVAIIHLMFNVIGAVLFSLVLIFFSNGVVNLLEKIFTGNTEMQVAWFHVAFNLITAIIVYPFIGVLVKLSKKFIKEKPVKKMQSIKYIDDHLLRTPSIALFQAKNEIENMLDLAKTNLILSLDEVYNQTGKHDQELREREDAIDDINHKMANFLIKLTSLVTPNEEHFVGSYFHVINDIERIGDHALNFLDLSVEMKENNLSFTEDAKKELNQMKENIMKMFIIASKAFDGLDKESLKTLDTYEEKIDELKDHLSHQHFLRLKTESCSMETTAYYTSVISGLERVADHLVNVGYSINNPVGSQKHLDN